MLERIQRVVNNHQLSCHHTDRYFYILRGFKDFIDMIELPVAHDSSDLKNTMNRYILEEELDDFDVSRFDGYKLVEVVFNLFEDNQVLNHNDYITLEPLPFEVSDKLCIFNQIDQLKDISQETLDNAARYQLAIDTLKEEMR